MASISGCFFPVRQCILMPVLMAANLFFIFIYSFIEMGSCSTPVLGIPESLAVLSLLFVSSFCVGNFHR